MSIPEIITTETPWTSNYEAALKQLHADPEHGLSAAEAVRRLDLYGYNRIESGKKINPLMIMVNQFISPFMLLLAIAAGLSFFFQEWLDGIAIMAVIVINAVIGFFMEFQAERSMEALKKLTIVPARVLRDGRLSEIPSEELVSGDIIFIEGGDMVTADARVIKSTQLQTDESALTGESLPIEKNVSVLPEKTPLAERYNMLYKGTFVTNGNAYALVVQTGMHTELGTIASMVQKAGQAATPLEKKIRSFSKKLIWMTVILLVIIFIAGIINGQNLVQMMETSIALAVAAIPEGLPIVSTLALAFGMLRMARHNVLVKKLSSVETLGGTNVICTDKTGTLTQNKIEAAFIQINEGASRINLDIAGASIKWMDGNEIEDRAAYDQLCCIAALCNTATYYSEGGTEKESGDPMEVGLLKMVYCGHTKQLDYIKEYPKLDEVPFSSDTKVMATFHGNKQGYYIAAKGAVEELLHYCTSVLEGNEVITLDDSKRNNWLNYAEQRAQSGLRMLAFAYRNTNEKESDFLNQLTLAGLIGFIDPPRPEVSQAIEECKSAGIKVVMITGDHPATAKNIALQLGLANQEDEVMHGNAMKPYAELTAEDKTKWLNTSVFARVSPAQKLDLVSLYQENKMVVGMTGDGVNDAPALKKADIGIAMGQRGTQVAQEVSDMVLKDDAFSSIVLAIKQGRTIFDNIRKFIIFLLSCNMSELFVIATAAILNLHFQLFPIQILYINLITDVLPALALGVTKAAPHIMERKPFSSSEPIIDRERWKALFVYSSVIAIATISAVFASHGLLHADEAWNTDLCNNILFYTLIFSQVLHVFNMYFERGVSFFKSEVFTNHYVWYAVIACIILALLAYWIPPIRDVLKITIYGWKDWSIIIVFAFLSLLINQLLKRFKVII